jgi:hypothetical protein
LLCLFFGPEDGGDIFLRNVGWLSTDYTAFYLRRQKYIHIIRRKFSEDTSSSIKASRGVN